MCDSDVRGVNDAGHLILGDGLRFSKQWRGFSPVVSLDNRALPVFFYRLPDNINRSLANIVQFTTPPVGSALVFPPGDKTFSSGGSRRRTMSITDIGIALIIALLVFGYVMYRLGLRSGVL